MTTGMSWAEEVQVTASVDKRELTLEDSVNLSIRIEGTQSASQPEPPRLPDFTVRSRGSSSSFQIINGKKSSSITYNFILLPRKTGTFTIDPSTVEVDGKKYQTAPITLVVREPSAVLGTSRDVFAEMVISNLKPYVQEQVTATLRIYHRVEIRNLKVGTDFPGFREEKLKGPVQNTRIVNGVRYLTYELPTALFPLRPGKVEIPATVIELDQVDRSRNGRPQDRFDPFGQGSIFNNFGRLEHKILRTKAVTLNVQPLPEINRPESFSNLVGEFSISSQLSREEVEVGDTATLTITVSGRGNIQDLSLPSPDWGESLKVYQDQAEYHPINGGLSVSGEKIHTYALVPLKEGELKIPPISLSYFDPTQRNYVFAETLPLALKALPGKSDPDLKVIGPGTLNAAGESDTVRKVGEDILPIHTGPEVFDNHILSLSAVLWITLGLMIPAGLFMVYAWAYNHRQRLKHDIAFSRSHGAHKQALKQLEALPLNSNQRDFVRALSLILREYIGNILNVQGSAITSSEVKDKLLKGNFSPEDVQDTQKLLEKFETLQYASAETSSPEVLIQESRNLLDRLEKKS